MNPNPNINFTFNNSLQNIIDQKSLKWIFVGGKGGVGKTTISSSLAILLTKYRKNVLIISTDPAHNLSDAFNQKLSDTPVKINGFDNLFGLELDPTKEDPTMDKFNQLLGLAQTPQTKDILKEIKTSFPGVDEALNMRFIGSLVTSEEYDIVVFDTAPTGHTLRLLEWPGVLGQSWDKIIQIKSQFGPMLSSLSTLLGTSVDQSMDKLFKVINELRTNLVSIGEMFKNAEKTTFIAVCIPEFLSVYETERLIEALCKGEIDIRNIVINQVWFVDSENNNGNCKKCKSRMRMQEKYKAQINEMFEDFHVVSVPLQKSEIRGTDNLIGFSQFLLHGK